MKKLPACIFIILAVMLLAGCLPKKAPPRPAQFPPDDEIIAQALNNTYKWLDTAIKLTDGVYETAGQPPFRCKVVDVPHPVGALDIGGGAIARGTALGLAVNAGGSGTFLTVVASYTVDGKRYVATDGVGFGDRNIIHNIKIVNGDIVVDYLVRKYGEPMAVRPTVPVTRVLAIRNATLTEKRYIGYLATAGTGRGTLADLRKGGLEVIKDQSFPVEFANSGKVQFVAMRYKSIRSAGFFLVGKNGNIVYTFPETHRPDWTFGKIRAIAFVDVDRDGLGDVIIINDYSPVAGPQDKGQPYATVHFQKGDSFVVDMEFEARLNDAGSNADIGAVLEYAGTHPPKI